MRSFLLHAAPNILRRLKKHGEKATIWKYSVRIQDDCAICIQVNCAITEDVFPHAKDL